MAGGLNQLYFAFLRPSV